jgi:hypothetical protein
MKDWPWCCNHCSGGCSDSVYISVYVNYNLFGKATYIIDTGVKYMLFKYPNCLQSCNKWFLVLFVATFSRDPRQNSSSEDTWLKYQYRKIKTSAVLHWVYHNLKIKIADLLHVDSFDLPRYQNSRMTKQVSTLTAQARCRCLKMQLPKFMEYGIF